MHPQGGCSFARHGTCKRVKPPGTKIPRWYCPESHSTFSLLADCFAARLSGTLCEVETVVVEVARCAWDRHELPLVELIKAEFDQEPSDQLDLFDPNDDLPNF